MIRTITPVEFPRLPFRISPYHRVLAMGSCFAESMSDYLLLNGHYVRVNPYGVMYNPHTIGLGLRRLMNQDDAFINELLYDERQDLYFHYDFHGSYAFSNREQTIAKMAASIRMARTTLGEADYLLLTFGAASVFQLKNSEKIVSNCHKQPGSLFDRRRLSLSELMADWLELISALKSYNEKLKIIITVSPVRYRHEGLHENALSKSTLLLLVDDLSRAFPSDVYYFPIYEYFMDELRDYRYYSEDLLHPSVIALSLVKEKVDAFLLSQDKDDLAFRRLASSIAGRLAHRPLHPSASFNEERKGLEKEFLNLLNGDDRHPSYLHLLSRS